MKSYCNHYIELTSEDVEFGKSHSAIVLSRILYLVRTQDFPKS